MLLLLVVCDVIFFLLQVEAALVKLCVRATDVNENEKHHDDGGMSFHKYYHC